eukprot:GHVR01079722.1.p1 GENE.GHVR01079722.1~~GHVR01079722.1.p1  ORF type:complete len:105 (+),score=12.18 GHVR01079722.1:46-360(+)
MSKAPPLYKNAKAFKEFERLFSVWVSMNLEDKTVTENNWKAPLILAAEGSKEFLQKVVNACSDKEVAAAEVKNRIEMKMLKIYESSTILIEKLALYKEQWIIII